MAGFRLRLAAENDLIDIGINTRAKWGDAQMRRYLAALDSAFENLGAHPELGRSCDDVRAGYRRHVVGSHVIFYRVEVSGAVDIVRIVHARMDVEDHLAIDDDFDD